MGFYTKKKEQLTEGNNLQRASEFKDTVTDEFKDTVTDAINHLKKTKVAGPDEITVRITNTGRVWNRVID